jgi:hypothetical protein
MPAAYRESAKKSVLGGFLVEIEGLRIEVPREGFDLVGVYRMRCTGVFPDWRGSAWGGKLLDHFAVRYRHFDENFARRDIAGSFVKRRRRFARVQNNFPCARQAGAVQPV